MKTLQNIGATLLWAGKLAALVALIVVFVRVEGFIKRVDSTVINFDGGLTDARTLLQNTDRSVNGTEVEHGKDGLLFSAKKGIDDVRAGAVLASRQEVAYYADLKQRTDSLGDRTGRVLDSLDTSIESVNKSQASIAQDAHQSFGKLDKALDHVPGFIDQSTATLRTAQDAIKDQDLKRALVAFADAAENIDKITVSGAEIGQDVAGKVHSSTHPSKRSVAFGIIYHLALAGATHIP